MQTFHPSALILDASPHRLLLRQHIIKQIIDQILFVSQRVSASVGLFCGYVFLFGAIGLVGDG